MSKTIHQAVTAVLITVHIFNGICRCVKRYLWIGTHTAYLQLDILNVLNQVRQKTRHMISTQEEYGIFTPDGSSG